MSIDPGVLLTVCNAGLQALQVCGSLDGVLGVGELAVAACIAQVDDDGAGLAVWGVVNLMEGYGNDNPGANAHIR